MLHPARRLWGSIESADCSLRSLERTVLGVGRHGDVPGIEIPARYFRFVRGGDARVLAGILEHNRSDLMALAALAGYVLDLLRSGPAHARDAREALALGDVYWRAGLEPRARDAYARAVALAESSADRWRSRLGPSVRIASLRGLAVASRRIRQFEEAARCWERLLETSDCPRPIVREAIQALAIHHEHRARDLTTAKAFTLRGLEETAPQSWERAARHRLARLERKLSGGVSGLRPSLPFWPSPSLPSCGSRTSARRTSS
jgi:hypothetical protein